MTAKQLFIVLFTLQTMFTFAQQVVIEPSGGAGSGQDVSYLVENVLTNSDCYNFSNIRSVSSTDFGQSQKSIAYFEKGASNFPFESGIVLSTGYVDDVPGPNNDVTDAFPNSNTPWVGDTKLEAILDQRTNTQFLTHDASVIEFDFSSNEDLFQLEYLFVSDEYENENDYECKPEFSDGFAILISGYGLDPNNPYIYSEKNIATIPNTTIDVSPNTVRNPSNNACSAENVNYYQDRSFSNKEAVSFNAGTTPLVASQPIVPGNEYHIKIVIADRKDHEFNSALFLNAGSIKSNLQEPELVANPVICNKEDYELELVDIPDGFRAEWDIPRYNGSRFEEFFDDNKRVRISHNHRDGDTQEIEVKFIQNQNQCSISKIFKVNFKYLPKPEVEYEDDIFCSKQNVFTLLNFDQNIYELKSSQQLIDLGNNRYQIADGVMYTDLYYLNKDTNCISSSTYVYFDLLPPPPIFEHRFTCGSEVRLSLYDINDDDLLFDISTLPNNILIRWYDDNGNLVHEGRDVEITRPYLSGEKYRVVYYDTQMDCEGDESIFVVMNTAPKIKPDGNILICNTSHRHLFEDNGPLNKFFDDLHLIKLSGYYYRWLDKDKNIILDKEDNIKIYNEGTYYLQYYNNECESPLSDPVYVKKEDFDFEIKYTNDKICPIGEEVEFSFDIDIPLSHIESVEWVLMKFGDQSIYHRGNGFTIKANKPSVVSLTIETKKGCKLEKKSILKPKVELPVINVNDNKTAYICNGVAPTLQLTNQLQSYHEIEWYEVSGGVYTPLKRGPDFVPSVSKKYAVRIYDGNIDCWSNYKILDVKDVNFKPKLSISKKEILKGEYIILDVDKGEDFDWSTGDSKQLISVATFEPTSYGVTATDEYGCEVYLEETVDIVHDWSVSVGDDIHHCDPPFTTTITATDIPIASYEWSNGVQRTNQINVTQSGTYKVEATIGGFTQEDEIDVQFSDLDLVQKDIYGCINFLNLRHQGGVGPVQYSLDGFNYQESDRFFNVPDGQYEVYVKDSKNCIRNEKAILESVYLKPFMSPNSDNKYDSWKIKGLDPCKYAKVTIYDRYGQVIYRGDNYTDWKGVFEQFLVPHNDYWYTLDFNDGVNPPVRGNITLRY